MSWLFPTPPQRLERYTRKLAGLKAEQAELRDLLNRSQSVPYVVFMRLTELARGIAELEARIARLT